MWAELVKNHKPMFTKFAGEYYPYSSNRRNWPITVSNLSGYSEVQTTMYLGIVGFFGLTAI